MQQLTEKEAENFLEKNKFEVAKRTTVSNKSQLNKVKIPFPWVMKVSSKQIMHKVKIDGVKTNITSLEQAGKYFDKLSKIENFEEVIIQKQISGKEIILGIKKTPEFGHVIMFGKGGSDVEKDKDISFRVLPIKENEIISMIEDTNFSKELTKKDTINIKRTINKIQNLIKHNKNIEELDINPLIVTRKQATTVDARLIFN